MAVHIEYSYGGEIYVKFPYTIERVVKIRQVSGRSWRALSATFVHKSKARSGD